MKVNRRIVLRIWLGISLAGLLAACTMLPKEKIANSTIDYNLAVEKVQNEMLLLNVVRASKRRPMCFTGLNLLRGNMSYNFQTGSLTLPFGKIGAGLDGSYSVAPSVGYSTSPSFDLAVLDTKEFTRGIMTPLSMETVDYYVQQGWPKEILFHLFINRIEKTESDGKVEVFDNYPEDRQKFEEFQAGLREILKCKLVARQRSEAIGPKIRSTDAANLQQLIEVHKAGLVLAPVDQKDGDGEWYQLSSQRVDYILDCTIRGSSGVISTAEDGARLSSEYKSPYRIHLRSPEGILYYLGEILRAETEKDFTPMIKVCESGPPVPLFVVRKSMDNDEAPAVAVDYEGTRYVVPRGSFSDSADPCRVDRSMHVISLVSQLISLHKSSEHIPVTGVVSVVGR